MVLRERKTKNCQSALNTNSTPTGKVLQHFEELFFLQHEIKHLFVFNPTFAKYTEVDENFRKIKNFKIPNEEQWQTFTDLM